MKDTYDFSDLDDILAEFSQPEAAEAEAPAEPEIAPEAPQAATDFSAVIPAGAGEYFDVKPDESAFPAEELPPLHARGEKNASRPRFALGRIPKKAKSEKETKPPKEPKAPKPPKEPKPPKPPRKKRVLPRILRILLGLVGAILCVPVLLWALYNLHPASGTMSYEGGDARLRLTDKLDVYVNNAAADALGELAYIRKIYTLQESDTVAPAPDPDGFGETNDLAEVQAVIDKAALLLDGQELVFRTDVEFVPGAPFRYYLDDTIFVLAWQEYIDERCCTFAEVKVAHGSQLRRKLAGDSYSSGVQLYASAMAKAANAVVAINGDFYEFRDLGITVYQRKLYRNNPATVDSCFFTADGDMLFSRAGELMGEGETQRFIEDNDVVFGIAFGPVLVDGGELQEIKSYPIGEINTQYSRSCISKKDELHYLLMNINWDGNRPRATVHELGRYVWSKGVEKAYTLDGGQTSEIVMMGGPINHVDFGSERIVSDIIYFATAIPEEVGA